MHFEFLYVVVLVAQMVKNLPAMWETWVWLLGQEDPLEEGRATHSSILAWRIPWTEESGGLQSMGLQRVGHNWMANTDIYAGQIIHISSGMLKLALTRVSQLSLRNSVSELLET